MRTIDKRMTAGLLALPLLGCTANTDDKYPYGLPVDVAYSHEVTCAALTLQSLGNYAFEVTVHADVTGDSEKITQVMVNWGTPDDRATTMQRGADLLEPHTYDYSKFGDGVYTITAMMITEDDKGEIRFVEPGDNCMAEVKIVSDKTIYT